MIKRESERKEIKKNGKEIERERDKERGWEERQKWGVKIKRKKIRNEGKLRKEYLYFLSLFKLQSREQKLGKRIKWTVWGRMRREKSREGRKDRVGGKKEKIDEQREKERGGEREREWDRKKEKNAWRKKEEEIKKKRKQS